MQYSVCFQVTGSLIINFSIKAYQITLNTTKSAPIWHLEFEIIA